MRRQPRPFAQAMVEASGMGAEHFYLFPEHQGCGLGSEVLRRLLSDADAEGRTVRFSALQRSDAARFYQRHGFVETGQDEWDIYIERPPLDRRLEHPTRR